MGREGHPKRVGAAFGLVLGIFLLMGTTGARGQSRPYVGYVYPAGGQQGTTVHLRIGGQGLEDVQAVLVTGPGVEARLTEVCRRLNPQEIQLLQEQISELRKATNSPTPRQPGGPRLAESEDRTLMAMEEQEEEEADGKDTGEFMARIQRRISETVQDPACAAIAGLVMVELTLAPSAEPGEREIRLVTSRGVSNPLPIYVGQVREVSKQPMRTAARQILGKEARALRKRVPGDDEEQITLPCTVNGQIGSGEVQHYRFQARRGQRLVLTALARQLVPFIADAVPGWFQPVLALHDSSGREVAYCDDYRFKPDPTLFYEVPKDGEYKFSIRDSLFRGREDFVYRITAGEVPFITSLYPLGGRARTLTIPETKGWNLEGAELSRVPEGAAPGIYSLQATNQGLVSNRVRFALDSILAMSEREPDDSAPSAQSVTLPLIMNGRIDRPGDRDLFRFRGRSNEIVVVEVEARRLDSPLDSMVRLTGPDGQIVAFNDDHEDLGDGISTHQADSYLITKLPADGAYSVQISDAAQQGGEEYSYRLRVSAPVPDFELRVVPSSIGLRAKGSGNVTVYALRKDGFTGPIKVTLRDAPMGFSASALTLTGTQTVGRISIKTGLASTPHPVDLNFWGRAKAGQQEITRQAVPAEDRMQAFLWRQLVPAQDLKVLVYDPASPPPKRSAPLPRMTSPIFSTNVIKESNIATSTNAVDGANPPASTNAGAATNALLNRSKFTKQQVAGRLRQVKRLYEDGLLTDAFYLGKVAECEAAEP